MSWWNTFGPVLGLLGSLALYVPAILLKPPFLFERVHYSSKNNKEK